MIKLAFIINFDKNKWEGGFNVILNLINAILINKKKSKKINIFLIVPNKKILINYNVSKNVKIIEDEEITKPKHYKKFIDKIFLIFFNRTLFLETKLRKYGINIISHSNICTGKKSIAKSIIWVPDFQFFHFPNNFSLKYKILKKINLLIYSKYSDQILLSSNTAKNDLKKICYQAFNRALVNSFCFPESKKMNKSISRKILREYKIPNKFFYLTNQYWVTKNHKVVLKALKFLKKRNSKIKIISTGFSQDYRFPNYFKSISKYINDNKLNNNFIYLGVVPDKIVKCLMHNCLAIINPSKFEGWNTSVEQGKAIGKKIILSNISTHKEQNPPNAKFFCVNNYLELARILNQTWSKGNNDKNIMHKFSSFNNDFKNYGEKFLKIIFNVCE